MPIGLASQGLEEEWESQADEYAPNGIISSTSTTVARVAGLLTSAPSIGPYALATQMAASTVSNIARLFGYSRPPVLTDINSYKQMNLGNLANTNVSDAVMKLSLDAKQELSVDPRIMGLG
eukprot:202308_1